MAPITEKAFAKGSSLPALEHGTLRLYSMRFCPFAQRTRLVLAHKNIPHETVNINLKDKPDWFLSRNPLGAVPVIEYNGKVVYDSAICDDYLDEVYPENKLTPSDPYVKARHKILMNHFGKAVSLFFKWLRASAEDIPRLQEEVTEVLAIFEEALVGKFFGGDQPAILDLYIWPWFERQDAAVQLTKMDIYLLNRFPKLLQWKADMLKFPAVQATIRSTEEHAGFLATKYTDHPAYDLGL